MVTLLLDRAQLEVALSPVERVLSRRSDSVRVDRAHIGKVQLTDDAWTGLRGVPSPGTLVRGTIAMGTVSAGTAGTAGTVTTGGAGGAASYPASTGVVPSRGSAAGTTGIIPSIW